MPVLNLTIKETPVSQPRPRVTRYGTYDPARDKKNLVRLHIDNQLKDKASGHACPFPLTCPVSLTFAFHMPIPRSLSPKKQQALVSTPHVKKPDIDNLLILYLNAMSKGLVYKDDNQVFIVNMIKQYSLNPRTEITVSW
jgi:Holliday junction resolvase RusA-like endonuclease